MANSGTRLIQLGLLGLCATATACGADAGSDGDLVDVEAPPEPEATPPLEFDDVAAQDLNLVDRLMVSSDLAVEFYEPREGALVISVYGRAGHDTLAERLPGVDIATLQPSDYYALLAPGVDMPEPLARAEARLGTLSDRVMSWTPQEVLPDRIPDTAASDGAQLVEKASHLCPASWFNSAFCSSGRDYTWCDLNKHTDSARVKGDIAALAASVCADIGSVTWTIFTDVGYGGSWTVLPGHYRTFSMVCGRSAFDFCDEFVAALVVTDAAGSDTYHHFGSLILD